MARGRAVGRLRKESLRKESLRKDSLRKDSLRKDNMRKKRLRKARLRKEQSFHIVSACIGRSDDFRHSESLKKHARHVHTNCVYKIKTRIGTETTSETYALLIRNQLAKQLGNALVRDTFNLCKHPSQLYVRMFQNAYARNACARSVCARTYPFDHYIHNDALETMYTAFILAQDRCASIGPFCLRLACTSATCARKYRGGCTSASRVRFHS